MSRLMRFYTYGLLGAIGGLIGWQISNILGLSFTDNLFLSEVIVGALLGGERGTAFRARAAELPEPPKRRLVHSGGAYVKFLKAGDERFREVSLTFDDGPGPYTGAVLDVLARYGIKATFFVIGCRMTKHPEALQRMRAEGHRIANHSWRHDRLPRLTDGVILQHVDWFDHHLQKILGAPYRCAYCRLPYNSGKRNDRVNKVLSKRFEALVDWSVDPRDWDPKQRTAIVANVLGHAHKRGAIVLMHDNYKAEYLPRALEQVVTALAKQGFRFVSLAELQGRDEATVRRAALVRCMRRYDAGDHAGAYKDAVLLARDNCDDEVADEAMFLAGVVALHVPTKRDSIPAKVARFLCHRYADSPFALGGGTTTE